MLDLNASIPMQNYLLSVLTVIFGGFLLEAQKPATVVPRSGIGQTYRTTHVNVHLSDYGLLEGYVEQTEEPPGLAVVVRPGKPAARAGMLNDDILTAINGKMVQNIQDVRRVLAEVSRTLPVAFQFRRGNQTYQVNLQPAPDRAESATPISIYPTSYGSCYGLEVENYQLSENGGVMIRRVTDRTAGANAGIQAGDIITAAQGTTVTLWSELYDILRTLPKNHPVDLNILRSGTEIRVALINISCPFTALDVLPKGPAYLGIYQTITWKPGEAIQPGITIGKVAANSAAERAGLIPGDRVLSIDGVQVNGPIQFVQALNDLDKRPSIDFNILRAGEPMRIWVEPLLKPSVSGETVAGGIAPEPRPETAARKWVEETSLQPSIFRAFPNPNSGLFTFEFSSRAAPVRVQVFDSNGALLFAENIDDFDGEYSRQFDFRNHPPGSVVIRVEQAGRFFSKIVLIQ